MWIEMLLVQVISCRKPDGEWKTLLRVEKLWRVYDYQLILYKSLNMYHILTCLRRIVFINKPNIRLYSLLQIEYCVSSK